jgi:plastocyanin
MRLHHSATLAAMAVVAAGVAVPVAASSASAPRAKATVVLKNIAFNPKSVTIKKGGSVTWKWQDGATPHTVTSQGKTHFKSASARMSGSYTVKFAKAGTYHYVCTIHPGMAGVVVVK